MARKSLKSYADFSNKASLCNYKNQIKKIVFKSSNFSDYSFE